ncbi:hypothetical protein RJ641_034316 [Dillenia turbinata]|uniref:Increased DNA methylation 1 C-terminal domain-containing protein n=1 Tax=Dillenia turbinata TaxID=194707 RepID=A0AAN8VQF7_9MAGN
MGPSIVASTLVLKEATATSSCEAEGNAESQKQSGGTSPVTDPSLGAEVEIAGCSPNQACNASSIGHTGVKTGSSVELVVNDERNLSLTKELQKACTMLRTFKVEMLVVAAIVSLVETWTVGVGFEIMEDSDKQKLNDINLMVFPGMVWLKKRLCGEEETGPSIVASTSVLEEATTTSTCEAEGNAESLQKRLCREEETVLEEATTTSTCEAEGSAESLKQTGGRSPVTEPSLGAEVEMAGCCSPNQTCGASSIGDAGVKTESSVELVVYDERNLSLTKELQKACTEQLVSLCGCLSFANI